MCPCLCAKEHWRILPRATCGEGGARGTESIILKWWRPFNPLSAQMGKQVPRSPAKLQNGCGPASSQATPPSHPWVQETGFLPQALCPRLSQGAPAEGLRAPPPSLKAEWREKGVAVFCSPLVRLGEIGELIISRLDTVEGRRSNVAPSRKCCKPRWGPLRVRLCGRESEGACAHIHLLPFPPPSSWALICTI